MSHQKPKIGSEKPLPAVADIASMPDFSKVIRGLARVPKQEVDDAIAKEKAEKEKTKRN